MSVSDTVDTTKISTPVVCIHTSKRAKDLNQAILHSKSESFPMQDSKVVGDNILCRIPIYDTVSLDAVDIYSIPFKT